MEVVFNKKRDKINIDYITNNHFILMVGRKDKSIYTVKRLDNSGVEKDYVCVLLRLGQHNTDDWWFSNNYNKSKKAYIKEVVKNNSYDYKIYAFNTYDEWLNKLVELSKN